MRRGVRQSYDDDDDYAAIQGSSTSHTGHTFCTCTSGDSSGTGGPTWLWFGGSEEAAQSARSGTYTWDTANEFCEGLGRNAMHVRPDV